MRSIRPHPARGLPTSSSRRAGRRSAAMKVSSAQSDTEAPSSSYFPIGRINPVQCRFRRCPIGVFRLHSGTNFILPSVERAAMARQFIYHMAGLNKAYGAKKILENIHLSFYPDAKIGILGPNGAGKSTVLRIMAGLDKEYTGEAWLAEGATIGYLAQEPQLDPAKTVLENVMEGVASKTAILNRYNELMMNYSDETADEGARL